MVVAENPNSRVCAKVRVRDAAAIEFGVGVVTISQFSVGLFSLSQFTVAGFAVAQFALAYACLAQFGIYIERGGGQVVKSVAEILGFL